MIYINIKDFMLFQSIKLKQIKNIFLLNKKNDSILDYHFITNYSYFRLHIISSSLDVLLHYLLLIIIALFSKLRLCRCICITIIKKSANMFFNLASH